MWSGQKRCLRTKWDTQPHRNPLNVQAQTPLLWTPSLVHIPTVFFELGLRQDIFLDQNKSNNCSEWLQRSENAGKLCAFLLLVCIWTAVGQKYKRLSRTDYLALALKWSQIDRARYSSLVRGVKKRNRGKKTVRYIDVGTYHHCHWSWEISFVYYSFHKSWRNYENNSVLSFCHKLRNLQCKGVFWTMILVEAYCQLFYRPSFLLYCGVLWPLV